MPTISHAVPSRMTAQNARPMARQKGLTLVVSLIMLVAITLLAVYAIRAGNTNIKIVGNSQAQAEADAAANQAIEQVLQVIRVAGTDAVTASMTALAPQVAAALPGQATAIAQLSTIPAFSIPLAMNGMTYTVTTQPLAGQCLTEAPLPNSELVPGNTGDQVCFQNTACNISFDENGIPIPCAPPPCKTQLWEVVANVNNNQTGARTTHVQGVTLRAPFTQACP